MDPSEFHAAQLVRTETAARRAASAWATLDTVDDWSRIASRVALITMAAQADSVDAAAKFTRDAIGPGVGDLNQSALVGGATDLDNLVYQPLDSYLYGAVVHSRSLYGSGATDTAIMQAGSQALRMLVRAQVADAARNAIGTLVASTPRAHFYRIIQPPCCQRCALLRDATFSWDSAFSRHPRCDCMQGPVLTAEQTKLSLIDPENVTDLSKAQRQAIADGADMNKVINAQRGIKAITLADGKVKLTTEGTTKRSWYAYVQRDLAYQRGQVLQYTTKNLGRRGAVKNYTESRLKPRLTPEAIYQFASTREEAVRLLALNGYIVGDLSTIARLAA